MPLLNSLPSLTLLLWLPSYFIITIMACIVGIYKINKILYI